MLDRMKQSTTANLLIFDIEICTLVISGSLKSNTPIAGNISNILFLRSPAGKLYTSYFISEGEGWKSYMLSAVCEA